MSHTTNPPDAHSSQSPVEGPGPDDKNPALIDAEHAFIITLISSALFIGAVFVFIL
jgi:hypothetical protein